MGGKLRRSQRPKAVAHSQLTSSSEEQRGDRGPPKRSMTLPNPKESATARRDGREKTTRREAEKRVVEE